MRRAIAFALLLMLIPLPVRAADQIIPVTVTNYPSGPTADIVTFTVPVPAGATEIVGWTGRVQTGPGVKWAQINWYHDGGAFHWLDGQNWPGTEPDTFANARAVMLPAGTGHKITGMPPSIGPSEVYSKMVCGMRVPSTPPNCFGWATFYFRVP